MRVLALAWHVDNDQFSLLLLARETYLAGVLSSLYRE